MSKVSLQKIRVTGYKKHYKILMQELHRSGVLEILENTKLTEEANGEMNEHFRVFDLARIDFAINFLSTYEPRKSKIDSILCGGKLILSEEKAKNRLQEISKKSDEIISRTEKIEDELVRVKNELSKIPVLLLGLDKLGTFSLMLNKNYETEQTKT